MPNVPSRVVQLIETFDRNIEAYKKQPYNETQVRREFIDPFFEALGWDVTNKAGLAQAYKDVIHEDAIKVGGATEAPDYCFRIGGVRKFFVEAKKPSVDIKHDVHPAYKLRRYGWSAKLPLSILTDFEEFAVYDCQTRPKQADKASGARIMYYTYKDYTKKWDEIANIFSKDAILKGSFDKFVASTKARRGTTTVDKEFLAELEKWRAELAKIIARRNRELSARDINFAVQRTIDRIIFLRMAEDRGIEPYGQLRAISSGSRTYPRLCEVFEKADHKYNSGLFYFQKEPGRPENPDLLTLNIVVDDSPLSYMLHSLYYPLCPYEFSVLPAEILGNVYEQFLGSVIQVSSGRQTKVEPKPEVKKAGGIYYTPSYIVDYIVKNTVGQLVENKTPKDISKLKILDPACGSGSFLISAYQYLLDWHIKYYSENGPEEHAKGKSPKLYQVTDDNWKLTTHERKRILLSNIFGVDIDSQAVEVTKLSLLLKVLEGESQLTLENQMRFFHERALPDLGNNIKCGNSLIGPDFYDDKEPDSTDPEEYRRINPFDYKAEFPQIFKTKNPGFDVLIGNPPYGGVISPSEQQYFLNHYVKQDTQKDLYLLFMEKYQFLLKSNALLGIIISNTWLQSVTYRKIRQYLTNSYRWLRILHLPEKVFKAVVDTHVLIFQKATLKPKKSNIFIIDIFSSGKLSKSHQLSQREIPRDGNPINVVAPSAYQHLFRKIKKSSVNLEQVCNVYNGVKPFEKGKGNPAQTEQTMKEKPFVKSGPQPSANWSPLLRGSLISKYQILWNQNHWILYGPWLAAPRDPRIFQASSKIMVRQTADSIIATLVESGFIARNNIHILLSKDPDYNLRYILGLMNSSLMDFSYSFMNPEKGEALAEVKKRHVEELPIHTIDFNNPNDKAKHDRMVKLVERMLDLHKKLAAAKVPAEKTRIQRQINTTDNQIDKLVYQLYNLTPEEIAIIEQSS